MARIRTVKPELWTDPEFVECSPNARLLFVAALNFASDYGVLPDKPKQLKMQCFPGDAFDIAELVDELIAAGFWQRRIAPDNANVLVIRTFSRHQKVDKPTAGRWGNPADWTNPPPEFPEKSSSPPREVVEPSDTEGKGMEGNGMESSSSERVSHLGLVPNPVDDDDFEHTLQIIINAKATEHPPHNPKAWRPTVRRNTITEDGELIRALLADGLQPEHVALIVLGHGSESLEQRRDPIPWCQPDCTECAGDAWIDTGHGLAPCPNRAAS